MLKCARQAVAGLRQMGDLPELLRVGARIKKYQITRPLSDGGMGMVCAAVHVGDEETPGTGANVAIKILKPEMAINASLVERFFQEAIAANKVNHEGIIKI